MISFTGSPENRNSGHEGSEKGNRPFQHTAREAAAVERSKGELAVSTFRVLVFCLRTQF